MRHDQPADRRRMTILIAGLAALLLGGLLLIGKFGNRIDPNATQIAGGRGRLSKRQMLERRRGAVAQAATATAITGTAP